jgi:hypothetical protein
VAADAPARCLLAWDLLLGAYPSPKPHAQIAKSRGAAGKVGRRLGLQKPYWRCPAVCLVL